MSKMGNVNSVGSKYTVYGSEERFFDEIAEKTDFNNNISYTHKKEILKICKNLKGKRVLDAGCRDGKYSAFF